MDIGIFRELTTLSSVLIIVVLFLYYLTKRKDMHKKIYGELNQRINHHLQHSNITIEENAETLKKVANDLKELVLVIKKSNSKKEK